MKTYQHITARINVLLTAMSLAWESMKNNQSDSDRKEAKIISDKAWSEYLVLSDIQRMMIINGEF